MINLLKKEFRLALHPSVLFFLALSAMLLIPSYPYYVAFFYNCLGIFFICLSGRENHDIYFSLLLPVRKEDIVRARICFAVLLQLAQMLLAVPFALLRSRLIPLPNTAGMEANIALFGLVFVMLGLFNWIFFTRYYRAPDKVGAAFLWGSAAVFLFVVLAEAAVFVLPFMKALDTADPQDLGPKLAVLAGGAALYALLTFAASRRAQKTFTALDL